MKRHGGAVQGAWVAWRRARNLRLGGARTAGRSIAAWVLAACVLLGAGGAAVIASHARQLGQASAPPPSLGALDNLRPLLGGVAVEVPERAAATIERREGVSLVIVSGMQAGPAADFDLCAPGPIRIGYGLGEVVRLGRPGKLALAAGIPRIEVSGTRQLKVTWQGQADFAGDAPGRSLRNSGWLVWQGGALHLQRRPARGCAAGRLALRLFAPGGPAGALVAVSTADGRRAAAWLPPGRHVIPADADRRLEDEALFQALQARGMLRLGADGAIALAPRDLAAWRAAPEDQHAASLAQWQHVRLDQQGLDLLARLYRMADGAYLRTQVDVFNSERRLLAWRMRPASGEHWQASVGLAPAPLAQGMPLAATRLFDTVPQGWGAWNRIARWPEAARATPGRLSVSVQDGQPVELMLAGRLTGVQGAQVHAHTACTGRACPDGAAVQVLRLLPAAGARSITVEAAPLDMVAIGGRSDDQHRHLRVAGGELAWHALPAQQAPARGGEAAPVTLSDRHGALLWSVGAPSPAAQAAGLSTMLGLHAEHGAGVAGMLKRLPGGPHRAALSIDLGLQSLAQAALDCVGLRQGRWQDGRCSGAQQVPAGRQAGMVILDTANGDILAAAGAGTTPVSAANWMEVRDFDRANPAASPLRLPALQHDGGVHRSPGSTFKIVTALGLEQAAQGDPLLAGLLAGMPLDAINRAARERGYAFQTAAATFPSTGEGARITNFRDQHLDRRAHDGRLGLAEALTFSLNTWFAWLPELSDRTLFGRPEGGMPGVRALQPEALDALRPVAAMARRLGFGQPLRLDGGLLPGDYSWQRWDALHATAAAIDPVDTRHELRQMAIGLRMQATPLQMARVAGAVGEGALPAPRLLLSLDGVEARQPERARLNVRLDRIRAGLKGVIDGGTAAGAFRDPQLAQLRRGLSGKTGTAPTGQGDSGTVWFTGWLEPGSLPGERRRLAFAVFVSHSQATGGEHAAPVVAAVLRELASSKPGQKPE